MSDPCRCGKYRLEQWCGTYGVPGEKHTRTECGPDGAVELNPIRAQLISHLHPHDITEAQAWAIMCGLINAFEMGVVVGAGRAETAHGDRGKKSDVLPTPASKDVTS